MRTGKEEFRSWNVGSGRVFVSESRRRAAKASADDASNATKTILEGLGKLRSVTAAIKPEGEKKAPRQKKVGPIIRQHGATYLATFRELYRSRDGKITVFEDGEGHITSVDSSRLV